MTALLHDQLAVRIGCLLVAFCALGILAPTRACAASLPPLESPERGFLSSTPAKTWEHGLIAGSGTVGANVFGRPLEETIVLTHERLFLPTGKPLMPPPDTGIRLFEIRRLIDRGLYRQATRLAFQLSGQGGFMYPDPFVPAFDMRITMGSGDASARGPVREYGRSVDFTKGLATVHWADKRGVFERRLFVSRPDGVVVLQMVGEKPGSVDCALALAPRRPSPDLPGDQAERSNQRMKAHLQGVATTAGERTLTFRNAFAQAYPGSIHALEGVARVVPRGGRATARNGTLTVTGADEVTVLIAVDVLYKAEESRLEATRERLARMPHDFGALLERHAAVHGPVFERMRLDIGGGDDHRLTTEQLIEASSNERLSRALIEKQFDAGRYNILSCTGQLPPTLQGVWAGTYVPAWASDFTQNGNVPSAIASILMDNMPELMRAYTNYMETMVPYMEINARHMFGARGIVLPSRSTTHAFNNALAERFAGGFWVAGAAWASHFFYDYYLYTGDRQFLAEHALPFMEKAALFFEDYLYEGPDGTYVFSPTQSPENTPGNTRSQGTFNATMDVAAAKELLRNLIAACGELDLDHEKIPLWRSMLKKMPPYMISEEHGTVKEWLTPKLKDNLNHRHSSQLYPLFDGMPDEIAADPRLQEAFRRIIEIKLQKHWKAKKSGFMSFGLVQLGQAATSLGEGDLAYACLKSLVNRYWFNNLASTHNHRSLFNMDISGGMPAVIIKMLVASDPGEVHLLPALPSAWPSGTIEGVLCRGQIEVERLQWRKDRLQARLRSAKRQTVALMLPADAGQVSVERGNADVKPAEKEHTWTLALPAGKAVELSVTRKK
ncbi:MAG: glycoside hydrolase N-terminal domain-containing protein [Phycisphaerae bacterium]